MATHQVQTDEMTSDHLDKFIAIGSTHSGQRTWVVGRLVAVEHLIDDDGNVVQQLTVAFSDHGTTAFKANYDEVTLADGPRELLVELGRLAAEAIARDGD